MFYPTGWIYSQGLNLVVGIEWLGVWSYDDQVLPKKLRCHPSFIQWQGGENQCHWCINCFICLHCERMVEGLWASGLILQLIKSWLDDNELRIGLFFLGKENGTWRKSLCRSHDPMRSKILRHGIQHIPLIFPAPNMTIDMWFVCDGLWRLKMNFCWVDNPLDQLSFFFACWTSLTGWTNFVELGMYDYDWLDQFCWVGHVWLWLAGPILLSWTCMIMMG